MTDQTAIQKVSEYMRSEIIKQRFSEVVGSGHAGSYISSVLLEVANNADLQKCSLTSIYVSALRAATLRLHVDSNLGQAYLVPFKTKGVLTANLIIGYKGLIDLCTRTGRYRYINVTPIYEGEEVPEDRITGIHHLGGTQKSKTIIGWLAAFELMGGFAKTLYMTKEEIHEHAKQYSSNYSYDSSMWKKNPKQMERKTVLRLLLRKWGYLDPSDVQVIADIEEEIKGNDAIDSTFLEVFPEDEEVQKEPRPESEILAELGFDPEEAKVVELTQTEDTLAEMLVAEKISENAFAAKATIKKLKLLDVSAEEALRRGKGYRGWRDMGATSDQAAKSILEGKYPK